MMQCNIKKQTRVAYEYKKNSPKREKIVRNLKLFIIRRHRELNFNKSSELTILQCKAFLIFTLRNRKLQLKELCLVN